MFKISFLNTVIKEEKNMTNCYCYDYRGIYNSSAYPTERFAERLPYRKMSKIYRLSLKVTVPLAHLVLPKIYKMESFLESFQGKIHMMAFQRKIHMMEYPEHRIHSIMRFTHRSVMAILRLNAPIRVAFMVALTVLDGCALIAILN